MKTKKEFYKLYTCLELNPGFQCDDQMLRPVQRPKVRPKSAANISKYFQKRIKKFPNEKTLYIECNVTIQC